MRGANFTYAHGPANESSAVTSYGQLNSMPSRNDYASQLTKSGQTRVPAQETNLKLGSGQYQNPSSEAKSMFQPFSNGDQSRQRAETNA